MMSKLIMIAFTIATTAAISLPPKPQAAAGQVEQARNDLLKISPGEILDGSQVTMIERPGMYGLGTEPRGSRYAVAGGNLVRIDPVTMMVLSVVRPSVNVIE